MKLPLILIGIAIGPCIYSSSFGQGTPPATGQKYKTYKTFAEQKEKFAYHKTAKATYLIQRLPPDSIAYGEPQVHMPSARTEAATETGPFYSSAVKCQSDIFAGRDRAEAKTHEYKGTDSVFPGFDKFYQSTLIVPDKKMTSHSPALTKDAACLRVKEEKVNVTIEEAYIYGIYREDDNDFHMIIGNGKTGAAMKLFNAEISGLPGDVTDNLLAGVRKKITDRFGDIACSSGAFKPVGTLIPIKITGSLFFDVDHPAGKVGFGVYKPKTAWEIHPVTAIEFLDQ